MARTTETDIGIPGVEVAAQVGAAAAAPADKSTPTATTTTAATSAANTAAARTPAAAARQSLAPAEAPTVITIDHPTPSDVYIGSDTEVSDLDADQVAAELAQFSEDPLSAAREVGNLIHANVVTAHEFHRAIQEENGRLMQLKQELQRKGNQALERARLLRIRAEQLAADAAAAPQQ